MTMNQGSTQPQDVTPVDNSMAPAAPADTTAAPTTTPTTGAPNPSTNNTPDAAMTHTPLTPQSSLHARLFDGILKTMSGGPVKVMQTDPTTGQSRQVEVPQSRSSMGKAIVAGVLSGMFAGAGARDQEGRHDPMAAASIGFDKGQRQVSDRNAAAQEQQDSVQARKMMTVKNNIDLAHQMAALTHQQHADLNDNISMNENGILKDAQAFDDTQTDPTQKIVLARGLTVDQAMQKLQGKMTSQNAVVDGYVDVRNPDTGAMEPHPTYAILNPDLKVNMNERAANTLARFIPNYKGLYDMTGGNIRVPVRTYISDVNKANTLTMAESFFKRADEALGVTKNVDLGAAARKGGKPFMDAIMQAQSAMAAGGNTANILDAVRKSPGGSLLIDALGTTPDKVDSFIQDSENERIRKQALAKEGGIGEKSPADPGQIGKLVNDGIENNPDLSASDKKTIMADVPSVDKNGQRNMTRGQLEKVVARVDATVTANKSRDEKKLLAQGDPAQLQSTASNIIEGDVTSISKLASIRGNAREALANEIHSQAAARGLDTTRYSQQALESKAATWNDYEGNKKGSTGSTISSFNAFLGHTANAFDAEKRLADKTVGLTNTPAVNVSLKALGKQLTNDADWKSYQTALVPVRNEIQNFLAAGYATKAEDSDLMHQILSDDETPARMTAALKQLAETADTRLAAMGQRYLDTMGTTYTTLLSDDSMNTLKRLGIESKAVPLSRQLPRGWNGNQPSEVKDPRVAKAFYQAAGRNKEKAIDLAKTNGWTLK